MEEVQRLKTVKEAMFFVFKWMYMILAFPYLLFMGIGLFFVGMSETGELRSIDLSLSSLALAGSILPIALYVYGMSIRRRLLKKVVAAIKSPEFFMPSEGYEFSHVADGKYLGIDTKNGTILYVHRIRKGQVDVVGLTMNDWTNREVEGRVFRLYTKFPELPRIEIGTPWAERWLDTLGAMEYKQYSTPTPFAQYVEAQRDQLERENRIHIPRVA